MWILSRKKKESNTFFFLWFVHGRLHALLSLYQWRSSVSWRENTLCQTVLNTHTRTEITFCSMSEGSWFIFLRNASFFRYGSFQVHLQTFRCARPTRKLYFSFLFCEVVKHLLVVVFLCVSYFWLSLFFATMDLSEKNKIKQHLGRICLSGHYSPF